MTREARELDEHMNQTSVSDPLRPPAAGHHCPDWDFLFIRPGDPEMECCLCGRPGQHSEETRRDALYDHERAKEDE